MQFCIHVYYIELIDTLERRIRLDAIVKYVICLTYNSIFTFVSIPAHGRPISVNFIIECNAYQLYR